MATAIFAPILRKPSAAQRLTTAPPGIRRPFPLNRNPDLNPDLRSRCRITETRGALDGFPVNRTKPNQTERYCETLGSQQLEHQYLNRGFTLMRAESLFGHRIDAIGLFAWFEPS